MWIQFLIILAIILTAAGGVIDLKKNGRLTSAHLWNDAHIILLLVIILLIAAHTPSSRIKL